MKRETFFLFSFYFFIIFVVYFSIGLIANIIFIFFIILFYRSENSAFWIALFFMLYDSPGYLLHFFDTTHNLGLYGIPLGGGRDLYFSELFFLTAFFKAYFIPPIRKNSNFRSFYIIIALVIIYIFVLSFFYETSLNRFFRGFRGITHFLMLFSLPRLLPSLKEYSKLFDYVMPFVFLVLGVQIFELGSGVRTVQLLGGVLHETDALLVEGQFGVSRPLYSFYILEFIVIGCLFKLSQLNKERQGYYTLIMILALMSTTLSATRGVTLAIAMMVILYLIFVSSEIKKFVSLLFKYSFILISLYLIITFTSPILVDQFSRTFERLSTLTFLFEGDITAGGSLGRLSVRIPTIMTKIEQNPIFGFGISGDFWDFHDGHIGHHNMVLNAGILGYMIFVVLLLLFFVKFVKLSNLLEKTNPLSRTVLVPIIAMIGILIHHSSTYSILSYINILPLTAVGLFVVLFIDFSDLIITESSNNKLI